MGCIPWAHEYMLRSFPDNEKRHPCQVVPFPEKGVDARDALTQLYSTIRRKASRTRLEDSNERTP